MSSSTNVQFEVGKMCGRGTFGEVYLAQPRHVSVKKFVMRRIRLSSQANQTKVIQEVRRIEEICKLQHPHLVHYEAAFLDNGMSHLCIVMEQCELSSLYIHIEYSQHVVPENKILNWLSQIVSALHYLHHEKKIVHGDLRAKNVFLWPNEDTCKVSDIRVFVGNDKECNDEPLYGSCDISLNSAQHLPPEFWQCGQSSTNSCFSAPGDMFALGGLLHFLCYRRDVFESDDFVSISRKVCDHVAISSSAFYSREIRHLIIQLLQLDWRKRPDCSAIMKMPLLSQQTPPTIQHSQQSHSSERFARRLKRLQADLQSQYTYSPLQSDSYPSIYSVDWSTLAIPRCPQQMCSIFHTHQAREKCELAGENVVYLQNLRSQNQNPYLVRIHPIPWKKFDLKQAPRAQLIIEFMPEAKFWDEGLAPLYMDVSGAYPTVDWAKLKGSRIWHVEWRKMVEKGKGFLCLPPLCIPFESGENKCFYLNNLLQRKGDLIMQLAHIHKQSPVKEDEITACLSLQLDIPLKSAATRTFKCEKTVFTLKHVNGGDRMCTYVWAYRLDQTDWQSIDLTRTPRMKVAFLPLPSDAPAWMDGMAPVQCDSSSWLHFDWKKIDSILQWELQWAEMISPTTVPYPCFHLNTPSILVTGDRHIVCALLRQCDHLTLSCSFEEFLTTLPSLPPLELTIHVFVEFTTRDGSLFEIESNLRLISAPNETVKSASVKIGEPHWSTLSANHLPKLRMRIIPHSP